MKMAIFGFVSKQNRGEPGALGNIRLGVDLLIKGPEPAGEYLGGNQETAFKCPSPIPGIRRWLCILQAVLAISGRANSISSKDSKESVKVR